MRILITGIAGFCGSFLAEHLVAQGAELFGLEPFGVNLSKLDTLSGRINLQFGDIRDFEFLRRLIKEVKPERVYHLAGITQLPPDGDHHRMYAVNVQGTLNILDTLIKEGFAVPFLLVGSGAQYGPPLPEEVPIKETNVCRPITHYAVTKAMQDLLGYSYWRQGVPVVRTRAFNIIGPRQSIDFVASHIACQIAEVELGLRTPVIELGNLDTQRDFVDVRDVALAYTLALERGVPGEAYNIGSGYATSIRTLLEILLRLSFTKGIKVQQSQAFIRMVDVPTQVADFSKLQQQTGWQPSVSLEKSLEDLLEEWRDRLRRSVKAV